MNLPQLLHLHQRKCIERNMRKRGIRLKLGFLASRGCSCDRHKITATNEVKFSALVQKRARNTGLTGKILLICNHRDDMPTRSPLVGGSL